MQYLPTLCDAVRLPGTIGSSTQGRLSTHYWYRYNATMICNPKKILDNRIIV